MSSKDDSLYNNMMIDAIVNDDDHLLTELFNIDQEFSNFENQGTDISVKLYHSLHVSDESLHKHMVVRRPLFMAAILGSFKVLQLMINKSSNLLITETDGKNLIHSLVEAAFFYPHREEALVEIYNHLVEILPFQDLHSLLMMDSHKDMRPLELAAQLGTFTLFTAIMNTKDIYAFHEPCGVDTEILYDISDYEPADAPRRMQSPMLHILLLDKHWVERESTRSLFESKFFNHWRNAKQRSLRIFHVLWIVLRVILLALYYIVVLTLHNQIIKQVIQDREMNASTNNISMNTSNTAELDQWLLITSYSLITLCSIIIIWDIVEMGMSFKYARMFATPKGKKRIKTGVLFYRIGQFLLAIILIITQLQSPHNLIDIGDHINAGIYATQCFLLCISILYFIQLSHTFGYFVICFQLMLVDFVKFLVIFLLFFITFIDVFHYLYNQELLTEGESGHSYFEIIYFLFLGTIGMSNVSVDSHIGLVLAQILFSFIMTIVLLNFVIGLFSNSLAYIVENKKVIVDLHFLSFFAILEARVRFFCPKLYQKLMHKNYVTKHIEGQIHYYLLEYKHLK